MEAFYIKGLGMTPNNEENKALLTKLGFIKDDTTIEEPIKYDRANVKRVKRSKRSL